MIWAFVAGFFVGGLLGVFVMALMFVAARSDEMVVREREENYGKEITAPAAGRR